MTYLEHPGLTGTFECLLLEVKSRALETEMSRISQKDFWENRLQYCKDWIAQSRDFYNLDAATTEAFFCVKNIIRLSDIEVISVDN